MNNKNTIFASVLGATGVVAATTFFAISPAAAQGMFASGNGSSILDRVAQIINVDKTTMTNAFKQAKTEEIQQKVTDGKLTQAEADEIISRLDTEGFDFGGGMHKGGRGGMMGGGREVMDSVLTELGITADEAKTAFESGKTLQQLAEEKGKTSDELKALLKTKLEANINQELADGKIDETRKAKMLENIDNMIERMITNNHERFEDGDRPDMDA